MPKLGYGYALYTGSASSLPSDISGLALWLKADAGVSQVKKSTLANGLLAYWNLDNNSWLDSSGNGRTLINNNGVGNSSGIINNGAIFDSSNWLKANSNINFGARATISAWVKTTTGGGYRVIFASNENEENNFQVVFNPSGQIYFEGGGVGPITSSASYNDDSWHFVVLKYGSGTIELSIDNVSIGTSSYTYPSYDVGFFIGANNNGDSTYIGRIDEVGAWSRALTGAEITFLYNSGIGKTYPFEGTPFSEVVTAWADQSGAGKNMTALGGNEPTFIASELNGKPVIDFATDKYMSASFPTINFTQQTVFIVFKFVSANLSNFARPFSQSNIGYLDFETPGNLLPLLRNNGTDDMWCLSANNSFLVGLPTSNNAWYISTTKTDGNNGSFFINASNEQTFVTTFNPSITDMQVGGALIIGGGMGDPFNSKLAEVIVYDRSLTTTERQQVEGYLNAKYAIY